MPRSFSVRIVIAFASLSLAVGLLGSWAMYQRARAQQMERIRAELRAVATAAAVAIDGDALAQLQEPAQQGGAAWATIQEQLDRIRVSNEDIRFVYTMRRDPSGAVSFVVDAPAVDFDGNGRIDEDEEMAALGEAYPAAAEMPALYRGFEHPAVDPELTHDRWGWMLSGYAPIFDSQGRSVGLVGVDLMAGRLAQLQRDLRLGCLVIVLAVGLGSALLAAMLSWRLVRPIRAMRRELTQVERGEREYLSTDLGDDELQQLALAFNAQLDSRRSTERQLQEGAKLEVVAQLSAAMAHDFANHLTVISTTAELLLMDAQEGSALQRRLLRLQRAAHGASAEVRRLLVFARRAPEEHKPVDLNELVQAVVDLYKGTSKHGVEVLTLLEADDAMIMGDSHALQGALLNLALNARDAMPDGGILTFGTARGVADDGSPRLLLTVADTGTGMNEEVQRRLFEPFYSTKPKGRGTGLGMLAVKSVAERHGATIRVDSTPGEGSTITLELSPT